ncbi:hypothetical protein AMAG_15852 [Allomyces macrogynus ATCC 38327]|uniref:Uncharacterized protein n=1 Tax=Allomyces macrogynus (strain ATCC 38327) TaxID=578462 RepID=A0A0L0T8Z7_ALLM3|nr:hypothetical protein AMAG_15852 [Allomyces macrogynus ATCC 38327]|eukprot:KNE71191.1 hypothetical protein AMAG_15852 [Allomyces macrogynus ATCC 38327]
MPRKSVAPIDADGHESDSAPPPDDLVYDKARYKDSAPTNPQTPLADLLALVREQHVADERAFAVRGTQETLPAVLSVTINGQSMTLPITTEAAAAQIVAAATRELESPGSLAFEVDATKVAVPAQDQWELRLADAARIAARNVGYSTVPLTMQLLHLLVILPGGRVVRSPATPRDAREFLTVVVPLASMCAGGQLVVTPAADSAPITFDMTTSAQGGTPYVVYRTETNGTREYLPVTSGCRVVLEYALLWPPLRSMPAEGDASLYSMITPAVVQQLAALHGRGRTFHYLLAPKSAPPGTSTKEFTDTPAPVMTPSYLHGIHKARADVLHTANQTLPEHARFVFFFARVTRRATHTVADRQYTLGPTYNVDSWSTYKGDRLANDQTASTYPVSDMDTALNPERAWQHQLWAGKHRTHLSGTVKNRRTVRTIYRRYVLILVPSTKLVQFLFMHVGATTAQAFLFAHPCNERTWYAEILRGIKLVAKKLSPHDGAAKLVDVATGFGNTDAVLSVFAGIPDLIAVKPAVVASLLAADAVWSSLRDAVLAQLRALQPAEARLAAIAQVMSALVDRQVPPPKWEFIRDWAADGLVLVPSSTIVKPLADPATAVLAALARARDVERVRRALRSAAVDAILRSGIDVVSAVLAAPAVWAEVRDEVVAHVDAVPPGARLAVCANAATAARARGVEEKEWASVINRAVADLPPLASAEFKQVAQALWRLILARSDSEVWAAYLVAEYVRQGLSDADMAAVPPLVIPHLPASTRTALAPLARARYAAVKSIADAPLPAKSWVIQGARFPTNPAIQAFLRSNDKEVTVTGEFGGIAAARAVAEQVSKNRKGVEARAHGTGKKASVKITKANEGFDEGLERKREASDEVRRLEGLFGVDVGTAEVREVPREVEELKRVVAEERARNAEVYVANRAKAVELERAAAEVRERAVDQQRVHAPAAAMGSAPAIAAPVATTAPVVATPTIAAVPVVAAPAAATRPVTAPTVPTTAVSAPPAAAVALPVPAAATAAVTHHPRVIAPPAIPPSLMPPAVTTAAAAMPWAAHYPPWFPQMYVPPAHPAAAAQYMAAAAPPQVDAAVAHQLAAMQYAAMTGGVYALHAPAGQGQGGAPPPPPQ